jgi:DNA-binding NtrC family response regulator
VHNRLKPEINQNAKNQASILLFEQEQDLRKAIVMSMLQLDMHVIESSTLEEARSHLQELTPKVLILDLDFPEAKSSELIDLFRQKNDGDEAVVLVITGERPKDNWRSTYKPDLILYKPLDIRYLIKKLQTCL